MLKIEEFGSDDYKATVLDCDAGSNTTCSELSTPAIFLCGGEGYREQLDLEPGVHDVSKG